MSKIKKTAKIVDISKPEATGPVADAEQTLTHSDGDTARKELENQLKRALADYQNLERRVEEERRLLGSLSSAILIEKFLPVLDNLESAQSHLHDEGLALVIKQFKDVLVSEGVEELETEGQDFNPHLHEAVEAVEAVDGDNDNVIVKEVSKGYKINDRVIRPAKVVVSRKFKAAEEKSADVSTQEEVTESPVV